MHLVGAVLASLAAAACFACSAVLQQRAASTVPESESLRPRLLLDLARRPAWLAGFFSMLVAYCLEAVALGLGEVAIVEPLIVTELVFALPLGAKLKGIHIGIGEWAGMGLVVTGVAVFLLFARPSGIGRIPSTALWLAGFVPCAVCVGVLIVLARGPETPRRASLLASASGLCFGFLALLTKTSVDLLSSGGVTALLVTFEPYLLAVVGLGGFLLAQSSYQAAPLAISLPLIDTVEPVVAVVLGATVLSERIHLGPAALALETCGALVAISGVFLLGRSPVVLAVYEHAEKDKREATASSRRSVARSSDASAPSRNS